MSRTLVKTTRQLRDHLRANKIPLAAVKSLAARTFSDCDQLVLSLFSTQGFSQAALLLVRGTSRSPHLPVEPHVLKIGSATLIRNEHRRFNKYVLHFVTNAPPLKRKLQVYRNWAALPYWQIGNQQEIRDLRQFYADEDADALVSLWYRLFNDVMGTWLREMSPSSKSLWSDRHRCFGISRATLEEIEASALSLRPQLPAINLSSTWRELCSRSREQAAFYECVIHGDLNCRNLLIERSGRPWLIDFAHTGIGHYLKDFAKLETEIKFLLLEPKGSERDVSAWLELDLALDDRWPFGEPPTPMLARSLPNPELAKAFVAICGLRALARDRMIGHKVPQIAQYRAAVLHYTLHTLRFRDVSEPKKLYAVRSAQRLLQFKYDPRF